MVTIRRKGKNKNKKTKTRFWVERDNSKEQSAGFAYRGLEFETPGT